MIEIIPATQQHIDNLKDRIRPEDVQELSFVSNKSINEILQLSFLMSPKSYVGITDGKVIGAFGCAPFGFLNHVAGRPWLLCSDLINKMFVRKKLLKIVPEYVSEMVNDYSYIENWIWEDNKDTIKFLKWAGFQFDFKYAVKVRPGINFIRFYQYI